MDNGNIYTKLLVILLLIPGLLGCGGDSSSEPTEAPPSYSVQTSVGEGGNVSPTSQTVVSGSSISFTITANTGYSIDSVTGCGGTLANNTYTTGQITADCTVTASFSLNTYNITAIADTGGSITPENTTISYGETASFTLTPDDGYEIAEVSGTCGGTLNDNVFITNAIVADCSVIAGFSLLPPATPSLTLAAQSVKTFAFSWGDVRGETEYRLLENADGQSGFSEVATLPANTTEHSIGVFLPARINAGYIISACNSAGCTDSDTVSVSGTLAEAVGYLKPAVIDEGDRFGGSIALSADGNTLAVSAQGEASIAIGINGDETDNTAERSGAVYVFSRNGLSWNQEAYLKASNSEAFDIFGTALQLSANGSVLAVSAYGEDSSSTGINGDETDNSAANSGAVYVFSRNNFVWNQQAYIKASNTEENDLFGGSISLSADGNTLAVGATGEDSNLTGINSDQSNNLTINSGAVYLFSRSGTDWSQQAYIKASNTDISDAFGTDVALSADGNTLAVGAYSEESNATGINGDETNNSAFFSGAVYIFIRQGAAWSQQAYVKASHTGELWFGASVALSADGNTMAVGALAESSNATGIDGDETNNLAYGSGAVYLFSRDGGNWSQQAYIKSSNTGAADNFGTAVTLSTDGKTLAVLAQYEDSDAIGINGDQERNIATESGAVYMFSMNGDVWRQQAYIKASNTEAGDWFAKIALSGDGNTLAVGAVGEDSGATGINGDQTDNSKPLSGAVYIY